MEEENNKGLSRKEANIQKVINAALDSFIKYGIEDSKISDIAATAGLTERSVFRYFDTKSDLVLAAAMLFWDRVKKSVTKSGNEVLEDNKANPNSSGIKEVETILKNYTHIYFNQSKQLVFVHEAEAYLYRHGKEKLLNNSPILSFQDSTDPLAIAIKKGLEDGSICKDIDIEDLYYNTYDSILGVLQKLAIRRNENDTNDQKIAKRLDQFCHTLMLAFKNI